MRNREAEADHQAYLTGIPLPGTKVVWHDDPLALTIGFTIRLPAMKIFTAQ